MLTIKLQPGQNVWWSSDYHVQHRNICRGTSSWTSGYRDFDTLQEMEDTIVSNFNSVVKPQDYVFNLGDLIFGDKSYLPTFLAKLNCKNIYLVRGNHDDYLDTERCKGFKDLFAGVYDHRIELVIDRSDTTRRADRPKKQLYILDHYPITSWREMGSNSFHLHAHCHGSLRDETFLKRLDIGVDVDLYGHKKFFPWSLDEVENVMYDIKTGYQKIDHHEAKPLKI